MNLDSEGLLMSDDSEGLDVKFAPGKELFLNYDTESQVAK